MAYKIAGIDVHKKMLAVVVADVEVQGEYQFEQRHYGSNPEHLQLLAKWLIEREVEEVVMESMAQYWKPVWGALERYWEPGCQRREGAGPMSGTLHLAQAQSNRGARGRKKDFPDAERLVKRLVANELNQGVRYEERGPSVSAKSRQRRTLRMVRELRSLGYRVEQVLPT
jgi:hypothetical protein